MPYVEIWVDESRLDEKQEGAIRALVFVALETASRWWPDDDAIQLERAAIAVAKIPGFGPKGDVVDSGLCLADLKYQEWKAQREAKSQ